VCDVLLQEGSRAFGMHAVPMYSIMVTEVSSIVQAVRSGTLQPSVTTPGMNGYNVG